MAYADSAETPQVPSRKNDGVPWLALSTLPEPLATPRFVLEPLSVEHAERDYEAFMSCRARLRRELDWRGWPPEGFTLEDNRADLERHDGELQRREAFAYTVLDGGRRRCLGCVYLEPCSEDGGGQLAYWLVDDALPAEADILEAVLGWCHDAFDLTRIVLPLRDQNERAIAIARALGLTPWVARRDAILREHRCFSSTSSVSKGDG